MRDKVVVIHQPDFLPYLGFFQRLINADIFIILDDVQYVRGSRTQTSRDKIKTAQGEKWISVGIKKNKYKSKINELYLSEETNWRERHLNLIRENYKKCTYFDEIYSHIVDLYKYKCDLLVDFNMKSIYMLMELFDIHIEIVMSSCFNLRSKSNQLIIDLVKAVDCCKYLSGLGAKDYYRPEMYICQGVEVIWQKFNHPIYQQQYGEFIPYLSSIDLLFNCGIEKSRDILRNC